MIATVADFLTMDGFSIDINLTIMCGIPKYPSPHARPETISFQDASNTLATKAGYVVSAETISARFAGFAVPRSPETTTIIGTATRAKSIRSPWKKSVQQTALNPPRNV